MKTKDLIHATIMEFGMPKQGDVMKRKIDAATGDIVGSVIRKQLAASKYIDMSINNK